MFKLLYFSSQILAPISSLGPSWLPDFTNTFNLFSFLHQQNKLKCTKLKLERSRNVNDTTAQFEDNEKRVLHN